MTTNIDELIERLTVERDAMLSFGIPPSGHDYYDMLVKDITALKSLQEENKALRELLSIRNDIEPYWQNKAVRTLAEWLMRYSTIMDYKNADMVDAIKIIKSHQEQTRKLLGENDES